MSGLWAYVERSQAWWKMPLSNQIEPSHLRMHLREPTVKYESERINGIHSFSFANLLDLHDGLCRDLLYAPGPSLDNVNSVDVQKHNVIAFAESLNYPTELARVWCSEQRWNTMIRQYLDPTSTREWLETIESAFPSSKRGIAVLRTNTVEKRRGGKGTTRRWGSCMLSLSFRRLPHPQITLHSRTSYLGYLSLLDLGVAHVAGIEVSKRTGIPVEDISFCWSLEMAQFHGFRCLAFPLGDKQEFKVFKNFGKQFDGPDDPAMKEYPGFRLAWRQYSKIREMDKTGWQYSQQTFSSSRRVRKRFHTETKGLEYAERFAENALRSDHKAYNKLAHVPFSDLTFKAIGL